MIIVLAKHPHKCQTLFIFHVYIYMTKKIIVLFWLKAMERAAKLRRLEGLRRGNPHISASALSSLVQDIQVNGLPDLYSRKHIKEARDIKLQEMTAYGPLFSQAPVIHKDGTERQLLFVIFFLCSLPFFSRVDHFLHWWSKPCNSVLVPQRSPGNLSTILTK